MKLQSVFFHVRISYQQVQESIHKVPFLVKSFLNCADQETDKVRNSNIMLLKGKINHHMKLCYLLFL